MKNRIPQEKGEWADYWQYTFLIGADLIQQNYLQDISICWTIRALLHEGVDSLFRGERVHARSLRQYEACNESET